MQREYVERRLATKRRFSESLSTDVASAKQSQDMGLRTYNPNRTIGQRGRPQSHTAARGRGANTQMVPYIPRSLYNTVRRLNNYSSPAKHILWSDNGVIGGNTSNFSGYALNNSQPIIQFMAPCSRGTTVQNRIGDIIKVSKIDLHIRTTYGSIVDGDVIIRYLLFAHKVPNGTGKTASNFLNEFYGDSTPHTNAIPNWNNHDLNEKYKVLKEGSITMRASMASVTEIRDWRIQWIGTTPLQCGYTLGTVGGIGDVDSNAIYLVMFTDFANTAEGNSINSFIEGNIYFHDA